MSNVGGQIRITTFADDESTIMNLNHILTYLTKDELKTDYLLQFLKDPLEKYVKLFTETKQLQSLFESDLVLIK